MGKLIMPIMLMGLLAAILLLFQRLPDAAFAWSFKVAAPGDSFAVASLIAIVVRGVQTVVEILYVGIVTALGRREGWSMHTGVIHPSPEEEAAVESSQGDAGAQLVGGQSQE